MIKYINDAIVFEHRKRLENDITTRLFLSHLSTFN